MDNVDPAGIRNDGSNTSVKATLVRNARQGGAFGGQLLHVQDEKAATIDGGTFTSGAWRTRDNNAVKTNEITGATLSSNQVSLPTGEYWFEWSAPAFQCDRHQTKLRDITNSVDSLIGSPECTDVTDGVQTRSIGCGRLTLADTTVFEVQHRCRTTSATFGFGVASDLTTEIYAILKVWKVG